MYEKVLMPKPPPETVKGNGLLQRLYGAAEIVFRVGTTAGMAPQLVKNIRLVNEVVVFVSFLLVPYIILFAAIGMEWNVAIQVAALIGLTGVVLLNRSHHNEARALALFIGNALVCLMTLRLGYGAGINLYGFAAVVAPLFFYSKTERIAIAAHVGFTLISAVGAHFWLQHHAPADPLPVWLEPWFFLFSKVGGLLTVFAFVYYFYHESARFEAAMTKANQEMQRLADTDSLTGVANRRTIDRTLQMEWARAVRGRYSLSVVIVDADHFKRYNDNYGHQAGDLALIALCGALRAGVQRVYDFVGRYGGEEFLLILPDTDCGGAHQVAERTRQKVMALGIPHEFNEGIGFFTCSLGVAACVPTDEDSPLELIRQADKALYRAKHAGRNRVFAGPEDVKT